MDYLLLKDSQFIKGIEKKDWHNVARYCQAVDKLRNSISNQEVDFFSLSSNKENRQLSSDLIWYEINNTRVSNSNSVVNQATFYTSHYIGFYSTKIENKTVNIVLKPRFGDDIFNYLLSYAYGLYLPKGSSSTSDTRNNNLWLIAIMWKATLERTMTKSHIPKEYKKFKKNLSTYRGKLNISKHIKHNLFDKSKFYCNYRKLTMDTVINQTIRYTYELLEKKGFGSLLKDIAEYDQMLQSFGVQKKSIKISNIQNIRYSKLNIYYKKVMELSSLILKSESKSSDKTSTSDDSFSYFIDIAELWENYLLKLLQKNLPRYNIYSPNERGGDHLIEDSFREIRPDIIIEEDGKIIAILDAKYKWYNKIGMYTNIEGAVSREDLYQMSTYLYYYADYDNNILGLFISPVEGNEIKSLEQNKKHRIGVLGLNIKQFDEQENSEFSLTAIEEEELSFINRIKEELQYDPI